MRGGFVIDTQPITDLELEGELTGVLRGSWGFRPFEGPRYRLRTSRPAQWIIASKDASALIVSREDTLRLQSPHVCCVSEVIVRDEQGKTISTDWKPTKADEIEVKVPLQNASAGSVTMLIKKFGLREADEIPLHTYAEAGRLDGFNIHAGDTEGILRGTRLDEVVAINVAGVAFTPGALARANQQDELKLSLRDPVARTMLSAGDSVVAHVTLKDGRVLDLKTTIGMARPRVALLSKSVQLDQDASEPKVHLGNPETLPQDGHLSFVLKAEVPESFLSTEKIEVATADESFRVLLTFKDGNLTLQDSKTVFAALDPMKLLGPSAFGPLKFRPVTGDAIDGDWQPLVTLVRIPEFTGVHCVLAATKQCALSGDKLFLLDSVSTDAAFINSVTVPEGFMEYAISIPPFKGKTLYFRLRDDPSTVNSVVVPVSTAQQ